MITEMDFIGRKNSNLDPFAMGSVLNDSDLSSEVKLTKSKPLFSNSKNFNRIQANINF